MRIEDRGQQLVDVPEMRHRGESYPHMISIASTHTHPPRSRLIGVSFPINEFDECRRDEIGLRLELGGELLEKEEGNMGVAEWWWVSGVLSAQRGF
jgi:hypothetical protein